MKKGIFIVAGVLAVGGLAYLYFANKKKQASLLAGGTSGAGSIGATIQTGATSSANDSGIKPLSVLDVVYTKQDVNLDKAKELVKLIVNEPKASFLKDAFKTKYIQQLKDLGYVYNESTGVLTKL